MDSWEFLLQKEGSRTWQPLKSSKITIEAGRYRVVAHSKRSNSEVEICVSHESTEEVPPKRRSQKRSRRTNREGLMVVIPFTYLKPGKWVLRCSGDIMSDLLGKSWQEALQLQVLPVVEATETEVKGDSDLASRETEVAVKSEVSDEQDLGLEIAAKDRENGKIPESEKLQPNHKEHQPSQLPLIKVSNLPSLDPLPIQLESTAKTDNSLSEEITPISLPSPVESLQEQIPLEKTSIQQPVEAEENQIKLTPDLVKFPDEQDSALHSQNGQANSLVSLPINNQTATNPIMEESLQMLDQILHQVLDPLWQELDPSEASEPQLEETPKFEWLLESGGLNLTLEDDSLVAVGKSFNLAGVVDVLDVHQLNGSQTYNTGDLVFQGSLRYELRDPQNSTILLNIQHPLPEQPLPLAFSQTLEIPSDCNTRLILGKVTLYSSTSVVLASQPFTVTADLNELLRSILPGTKVMPVAKMLVVSPELPVSSAVSKEAVQPEPETVSLNQVALDLINTRSNSQSRPLQPVSQQPLPPQIYQPSITQKPSKSLQLPNFPRLQPPVTVTEVDAVEVKEEDSVEELVALAKELFPETATTTEEVTVDSPNQETLKHSQEKSSEAEALPEENLAANAWDEVEVSELPVAVGDSSLASSEISETVEAPLLTEDSWLDSSETTASALPTADAETIASQVSDSPKAEKLEVGDEPVVGDNAFPDSNIQNRFWLRLNSLAIDEQFSQWLQSDLAPSLKSDLTKEVSPPLNFPTVPSEVAKVRRSALRSSASLSPNPDTQFTEAQEVTQTPNPDALFTNFDNSMWQEAEDLGTEFADEHQLQVPVLEEETPPVVEETPQEPPEALIEEVAQIDWDAQEFVVEDEEALPSEPILKKRETLGKVDAWEMVYPTKENVSKPKPVIIPPPQFESPIPAPTIVLATNELTAGETIIVRVKLPPNRVRLAVKLWLQDRQSRYLLDGPRWLVDLLPDGTGKLEAMTQLVVPFGSVDIRFEAIAVDLDSQRESHKVAVDCVVVPSDLVKFGLDEFDA